MGIRPTAMTVFGLDNYQGPEKHELDFERKPSLAREQARKEALDNDNWDLLYIRDFAYDYSKKRWREFYDMIYYGNWEYGVQGIVGLIVSQDFESDTFRTLSLIYPEYEQSGYKIVPALNPDERRYSMYLRDSENIQEIGGIGFQTSWLYGQGYHRNANMWAFIAKWLLDDLGIVDTDPTCYKWMLVWEWS